MSFRVNNNSQMKPIIKNIYKQIDEINAIIEGEEIPDDKNYLIWRSLNGVGNNLEHPNWGKTNIPLLRRTPIDYADGISTLSVRGPENPNPRVISNKICEQVSTEGNPYGMTDMVWGWGQFLSHELAITPNGTIDASFKSPPDDEFPDRTINFKRSAIVPGYIPIQQPNGLTPYIDASNVYGTNDVRLTGLRLNDGTGRLKYEYSKNGEIVLPLNVDNLPNANNGKPADTMFLAGDVRSNENVVLTCMHTLFMREHNRLCLNIINEKPEWKDKDELIFQQAKRILSGIMQSITYNEFLPALFGEDFPKYEGYKDNVNPGILTEFATVAYRIGHTLVTSKSQIGDNPDHFLELRHTFFNPDFIKQNGVDGLLYGSTLKECNNIDNQVISALRSFLFGPPTATNLLDLAALNIQRGRDRGVPVYNVFRESFGLKKVNSFEQITKDKRISEGLKEIYKNVEYIDPWIGILAEDHLPGATIGPLMKNILTDQFINIRSGDRFWYEIDPALSSAEKSMITNTKLSDVISRNTTIPSSKMNVNVFRM
jgi:hypothetical protein